MSTASVTCPVFILSAGRSGSQLLWKALAAIEGVASHHEFRLIDLKPQIVKYLFHRDQRHHSDLIDCIQEHYFPSIIQCDKPLWADNSYILAPVIQLLYERFPTAKFVHLLRSGVKVVASWYYKLTNEIYDDESTRSLHDFLTGRSRNEPPHEKKYWWYIPPPDDPDYATFMRHDQFERVCYHWYKTNHWISSQFAKLPPASQAVVRLEDLAREEEVLRGLWEFLGIKYDRDHFGWFTKPFNVHTPRNYTLDNSQLRRFERIAGTLMTRYGYDASDQYQLAYDNPS
ncbi:MAG: sulfotransferase [Planctomycetes bacterium]|nr:sulfotransferase [Planctomycetota bacterium]